MLIIQGESKNCDLRHLVKVVRCYATLLMVFFQYFFENLYFLGVVPLFLVYSKVLNIRCSVETLRTIKKKALDEVSLVEVSLDEVSLDEVSLDDVLLDEVSLD